ncbi:MAG: hypothetical protein K6F34_10690 [Lachnospiraceae bacterium]|nr:hypothetical protein [Lachnospiraceae bacterium]
MEKYAVIFPGMGYTKDRPLLYYSGKLAVSHGYRLVHIDFAGLEWSKEKLKDPVFMRSTLDTCLDITERTLVNTGIPAGSELTFISKSIGTVAATAYALKKNLKVKQICFSPLTMIEDYIRPECGTLFYGDKDPFADHLIIERIAKEKNLDTYRISGGNHSLETGEIHKDITNLQDMIHRVEKLL